MNKDKLKYYCSKDLVMENGEKSFTKGFVYIEIGFSRKKRNMRLVDDSNDEHTVGGWKKHFHLIKNM